VQDHTIRFVTAWRTLVVTVAVVAASCGYSGGDGERRYALPDTLCGLPVAPELYTELFPPGDELEVSGGIGTGYEVSWCSIRVDGDQRLLVETWLTGGVDRVAATYGEVSDGPAEEVPGRYEAALWDGLAVASALCTLDFGNARDESPFSLAVRVEEPSGEETRNVLRGLIQPAIGASVERLPCVETSRP
jgi:hypothetical protein